MISRWEKSFDLCVCGFAPAVSSLWHPLGHTRKNVFSCNESDGGFLICQCLVVFLFFIHFIDFFYYLYSGDCQEVLQRCLMLFCNKRQTYTVSSPMTRVNCDSCCRLTWRNLELFTQFRSQQNFCGENSEFLVTHFLFFYYYCAAASLFLPSSQQIQENGEIHINFWQHNVVS